MKDDYLLLIKNALEDAGIYLEDFNGSYKIKDLILDSLSSISFYIEIENKFDIEIPEEYYNENSGDLTFHDFLNSVILPLCEA